MIRSKQELIYDLLYAENPRQRSSAAEELSFYRTRDVEDALRYAAMEDSNSFVRAAATRSLGHINKALNTAYFQQQLSSPSPDVRVKAIYNLGELSGKRTVQLLVDSLRDKAPAVREAAARMLGKIGISEESVIHALQTAYMFDNCGEVREAAKSALSHISNGRMPYHKQKPERHSSTQKQEVVYQRIAL